MVDIPGYDAWKTRSPYEAGEAFEEDPPEEGEEEIVCTFCQGPHDERDCPQADESIDEDLYE